ncbi:hypothetical protein PTE30175_03040 [Pandoraea terrae]|uniref:Uncharacterized protein n=1 Tax=Pandoraea terrae TaxID=1537710 RepID=A0A5E4W7Z3_9BURK|nr:hypothetical protein [Pandoraea terrae]VVE20748.1 hypothetical protein PTE30175_03040 [Pandoraea terrae]
MSEQQTTAPFDNPDVQTALERLDELVTRLAALSSAATQGGIESLDQPYLSAYFLQMEELAMEAHLVSNDLGMTLREAA